MFNGEAAGAVASDLTIRIWAGEDVHGEFLARYLSALYVSGYWRDRAGGVSGSMKKITRSQILAELIPVPPLAEQRRIARRIAAVLGPMASARDAVDVQMRDVALLSARVRKDVGMELAMVPKEALGALVTRIESGRSIQTTELPAGDDQLGVLKVSAVSWGEFRPCEAKAVERGYQPEDHHRVRKGDVLISRANTVDLVGAVVRVDRDYPNRLLSDKTLRLILDEKRCDPEYIVQALRLPEARAHIEGNATGTSNSMRNISQDAIRASPVPLPSLSEQRRFAIRFNAIQGEIAKLSTAVQKQIQELELMPQKLLTQVFGS
jgi:type I restriction enzyme S subunit